MKVAEQPVEVDIARFVRRSGKGLPQRRCDAELVIPEIYSNHFVVAGGGRVFGHGGSNIHGGITIDGPMSFVFDRFHPWTVL